MVHPKISHPVVKSTRKIETKLAVPSDSSDAETVTYGIDNDKMDDSSERGQHTIIRVKNYLASRHSNHCITLFDRSIKETCICVQDSGLDQKETSENLQVYKM